MTDDYLGLEDSAERVAASGPALMVPSKVGPRELIVLEEMHRRDDDLACNRLIFTEVDDVAGEERWATRARGDENDEASRWKTIMGWPRIPTVEEAQQFKANALAARLARWWDRLAAARAEDEAEPERVAEKR